MIKQITLVQRQDDGIYDKYRGWLFTAGNANNIFVVSFAETCGCKGSSSRGGVEGHREFSNIDDALVYYEAKIREFKEVYRGAIEE